MLYPLVFIHELGHFLAAKKAGIKVEEFGLGYPPRLFGIKRGETIYSINAVPFGGFTNVYGLEEIEKRGKKGAGERRAFWAKSKKARALVLSAGILMNFLLAIVLFSLVYSIMGVPKKQGFVEIIGITKDSPAEKAGIKEADIVVNFSNNEAFVGFVNENLDKEISLELERQGVTLSVVVVPRKESPEGEGPLGVIISDSKLVQPPLWQRPFLSLWLGAKEAVSWLVAVVLGVGGVMFNFFFKGVIPKDITGPIGIVQVATHVAKRGVVSLLQFVAILSVNLSVLNLLPIPALDGGRLLFLGVEAVTGKKPRPIVEKWINTIGMIFLLLLMLAVTIQDIKRILGPTPWPF